MKSLKAITVSLAVIFLCLSVIPLALAGEKPLVKIGFIGPLTGPNAAFGLGARNSADLAVKQANERENAPYKYELVVMDDASDPSTGVALWPPSYAPLTRSPRQPPISTARWAWPPSMSFIAMALRKCSGAAFIRI